MSAVNSSIAETDGDDVFAAAGIEVEVDVLADGRLTVEVTVARLVEGQADDVHSIVLSMDEARQVAAGIVSVIR